MCAQIVEQVFGGVGIEFGDDDGDGAGGALLLEKEGEVGGVVGEALLEIVDGPDVHFDGAVGVVPERGVGVGGDEDDRGVGVWGCEADGAGESGAVVGLVGAGEVGIEEVGESFLEIIY